MKEVPPEGYVPVLTRDSGNRTQMMLKCQALDVQCDIPRGRRRSQTILLIQNPSQKVRNAIKELGGKFLDEASSAA